MHAPQGLEIRELVKAPVRVSCEGFVCKVDMVSAGDKHESAQQHQRPEPLPVGVGVEVARHDHRAEHQQHAAPQQQHRGVEDGAPRSLGRGLLELAAHEVAPGAVGLVSVALLVCPQLPVSHTAHPDNSSLFLIDLYCR